MNFLLSHWHCILPVAAIIVAGIFMREKPKKEDEKPKHRVEKLPGQYDQD
jgi:hypothetical protein